MGIGTLLEDAEKLKKLSPEERKKILNDCLREAWEKFNAIKATFIPEVGVLVDACEMQRKLENVIWSDCDFGGKKILKGTAEREAAFANYRAGDEANATIPNYDQLQDIEHLYENLLFDNLLCQAPIIVCEYELQRDAESGPVGDVVSDI